VDQSLRVDRLDANVGDEVVLDQVLLLSDGELIQVGRPLVAGAQVKAKVLGHDRAKKILVFKKKRRQGYHKAQGHRQDFTALKITAINSSLTSSAPDSSVDET
jgi:large subunit ribosomal protein L21